MSNGLIFYRCLALFHGGEQFGKAEGTHQRRNQLNAASQILCYGVRRHIAAPVNAGNEQAATRRSSL